MRRHCLVANRKGLLSKGGKVLLRGRSCVNAEYVSWTELQRMAADNATSCADIKKAIIRGINLT